jgi:diguanylate cyclase (GGDEF)-like protein
MTLFRQLIVGVSGIFFALLGGIGAIYFSNSRTQLQDQLASQAQETATMLALRLGALRDIGDRALVDAIVRPVFDRGYFQEIRVASLEGGTAVHMQLPKARGEVPEWFTRAFPLHPPGAQSLVSSGWRELGRVTVVSHPNFAYRQLWRTGWQTLAWLALLYAAALAAATAFLSMLLRPLREIERTAVAIGEREFRTIGAVPRARELARVVGAMNSMSGKIGRIVADESARAEALRREAFVDPLTSLYNRRGFERQLQSLVQSRGDVFSGALAMVEISHFGAFNHKAGYQRGDEVLALLAGALAGACEGHAALCARLGGAGFAFAAVNVGEPELRALVAEVCRRFGFVLAEQGAGADLQFQCGATRHEGGIPAFSALLASADHALQRARERGSNEFEIEVFDEAVAGAGSQAWRARIEQALDEGRIVLFAQSVLGLPDRKPVHSEVLVRMIREHGEPLAAGQFMPMAARHGLAARVDCRVVEIVLDHLARGVAAAPLIALNLSARTLAEPEASDWLLARLDARRDLASRMIFELTEFGALQDPGIAERFSAEVRRRGARFAIDNFSMHQDSLMLVHALKPHYIKLSPAYARELAGNEDCRFFVASLVRMARPLDIGVFAQAVEDENLVAVLSELGLTGYQGHVHSRPAPVG